MCSKRKIQSSLSIIAALKKMDEEHVKSLLVFANNKFLSLLTIGDIQRAIIANCDLNSEVVNILDFKNKKYCSVQDSIEDIKSKMLQLRAECMPVVSLNGNIERIYFWEELFMSQSVEQNRIYKRTSMKAATSVRSVAETVAFLVSSKACSITGQNVYVDNGTI